MWYNTNWKPEDFTDIPKPLTLRDNRQHTYQHSTPIGHKIQLGSLEHWLATIPAA